MKKFFTINIDLNFIIQLLILSGLTYIIKTGYNDHIEIQKIKRDIEELKTYRKNIEQFKNNYDTLLVSFYVFKTKMTLSLDEITKQVDNVLSYQKSLIEILNKNQIYNTVYEKRNKKVEIFTAK